MDKILKQTSWLFVAQALGKAVGFFYTIFLAKNLTVSDFGLYATALSFFSLTSSIADFGFNRFLIREVARDHLKIPQLLCNISILRLTLSSVLFALFALTLYVMDPDKLRVGLVLLAILTVVPQGVALTIDAIFVALQKLQYSALSLVVLNLSTALLGIYFLKLVGVSGVVVGLILGQLIYLIILGLILKSQKVGILSNVDWPVLKKVMLGSLPYGILGILGLLYFKIDNIILAYLKGNFAAGIYGAAYKFLESVVFIPSTLSTALFPILARLHDQNSQEIKKIYWKSLRLLFWLGILIAAGYLLILPLVIKTYLPNYLMSIEVIKILSLSIPFMFIHVPGAQVLLATDKYLKEVLMISIFTLIFNITLNLIFIPHFGVVAAAWVTVVSEVLTLLIFFHLLKVKVLDG